MRYSYFYDICRWLNVIESLLSLHFFLLPRTTRIRLVSCACPVLLFRDIICLIARGTNRLHVAGPITGSGSCSLTNNFFFRFRSPTKQRRSPSSEETFFRSWQNIIYRWSAISTWGSVPEEKISRQEGESIASGETWCPSSESNGMLQVNITFRFREGYPSILEFSKNGWRPVREQVQWFEAQQNTTES